MTHSSVTPLDQDVKQAISSGDNDMTALTLNNASHPQTPEKKAANEKASKFWDKLAAKYAARPVDDPKAYEHTLSRTKAHLKPSDHMLEIGCGTGTTSLILLDHVRHITAQDYSREMIDIAEKKREVDGTNNVTFAQSSVDDLPSFETYDVVFASSLLHLLPDLDDALVRIQQSVEPGGLFISKTVCLKNQSLLYDIMVPLMRLIGKAPYVNFVTGDEIEEKIKQNGFEILEADDHNHKPACRFVVARRIA
ncbi:MAG: methyltransferase domain-containing protein [Rhizobiaceae bacterium]|nr:methyltransferase domain-containing protein [Rhizobiaceae bacterium]